MRLLSVGARPTLTPCNALLRTLHLNLSVLFTDDENIASPQTINSSAQLFKAISDERCFFISCKQVDTVLTAPLTLTS